jgi:signal transduction histidine kinase
MNRRHREERRDGAIDALQELDARSSDLVTLLDRSLVLRGAVERMTVGLGLDIAFVAEPHGPVDLRASQVSGARTDRIRGLSVPKGRGVTGRVFALGRVDWVDDYFTSRTITHHFDHHGAAEGVYRVIAVPVRHQGEVIAVLTGGARTDGSFGSRAAGQLEDLARTASSGIVVAERARTASKVAVQEERHRMALELHDSVGAMMFALGANLRELARDLDASPDVRARVARIERQALDAAATLRESLLALDAPPEELALEVALHADCRAFEERTRIAARLVVVSDVATLPAGRVRVLGQAVREALLNIEKHARATSVVVTVGEVQDGVVVAVTDDGVGFTDEERGQGMGLQAVEERLARIGGRLVLDVHDDGGMTFRAWVPT